jgi:hypothetical protein
MKGQQEVLTPLLFTGILIAVVGSVYFWGVPLIQKNQDITTLHKAEDFMKNLNEKIISVANTQGSDKIAIEAGTLHFFNVEGPDAMLRTGTGYITLDLNTKGTIYSVGMPIPFVRNQTCHTEPTYSCIMGRHEPQIMYASSQDLEGAYATTYYLSYRKLKENENQYAKTFQINLTGSNSTAGENHYVILEFKGIKSGTDSVANVQIRLE